MRYNSKMVQDRRIVSIKVGIGSHMHSIKWQCFRWPWVTPNHPTFWIIHRLSFLCTGWT